jgi:molybdenum cofactor biosynthesis protein B
VNPHKHNRNQRTQASFSLLITSDSRDELSDESGRVARALLTKENHNILDYKIVGNNPKLILEAIQTFLEDDTLDVIITSGGTGISSRDVTVDTLSPLFKKNLNGFGELFRTLSYKDIGEAAMISRATAGIIGKKIVFCIPGSTKAMELALTSLILPSIGHLLWEVKR